MLRNIIKLIWIAGFILLFLPCAHAAISDKTLENGANKPTGSLDLPFIDNKGQLNAPSVKFYADTFACRLMVTPSGRLYYAAPGRPNQPAALNRLIGEQLVNAAPMVVRGEDPNATNYHVFNSPDPKKGYRSIPSYHTLSMGEVYKGIALNLKYHDRNVEKLFYLDPGADPNQIKVAVDNVQRLSVNAKGELVLYKSSGNLHFSKPVAYQWVGKKRCPVAVAYQVTGKTYGFKLGPYDHTRKLIIDPLVNSYSIESSREDSAISALAADNAGNVYGAGISNKEFVVYKFDPQIQEITDLVQFNHSRLNNLSFWSDMVTGIALDSQNNVFVTGTASDHNFPVTEGCLDPRHGGNFQQEGFIIKFDPDLKHIMAATYLGGDSRDRITSIAIDKQDNIYVVGHTAHPIFDNDQKFPKLDTGFDPSPGEAFKKKGFISKIDNDLTTLLAFTFLGGNEDKNTDDIIGSIVLDEDGRVYVGGATTSRDFPVRGGADMEFTGKSEAFLSRFNADLTQLEASTFLGGMNVEDNDEQITTIIIDNRTPPAIYASGWTNSTDFPISTGHDTSHNREEDGFIVKLDMDLSRIEGGTFLGGNSKDEIFCMALAPSDDGKGFLIVSGVTESPNFPTTPGCHDDSFIRPKWGGGIGSRRGDDKNEGFIAFYDLNLTNLVASTFFGGDQAEFIDAVLVNGDDLFVSGQTGSDEEFLPLMPGSFGDYFARGFIARFSKNINNGSGPDSDDGNIGGDGNNGGDGTSIDKEDEKDTGSGGGGGGGGGCFIDAFISTPMPANS